MKRYYASLVRELNGYYVAFEAKSENTVREYLTNNYGKLWCSVYTEEEFERIQKRFGASVPNTFSVTRLGDTTDEQ